MTDTKFTPGPWEIDNGKFNITICHQVGTIIAEVYSIPEAKANAHLIAASPDLYEALDRILEANEQGYIVVERMQAARATLAKARGET